MDLCVEVQDWVAHTSIRFTSQCCRCFDSVFFCFFSFLLNISKNVREYRRGFIPKFKSENSEEEIITGQSGETGNIGYTREKQTKQKHDTICVGHHKHK